MISNCKAALDNYGKWHKAWHTWAIINCTSALRKTTTGSTRSFYARATARKAFVTETKKSDRIFVLNLEFYYKKKMFPEMVNSDFHRRREKQSQSPCPLCWHHHHATPLTKDHLNTHSYILSLILPLPAWRARAGILFPPCDARPLMTGDWTGFNSVREISSDDQIFLAQHKKVVVIDRWDGFWWRTKDSDWNPN